MAASVDLKVVARMVDEVGGEVLAVVMMLAEQDVAPDTTRQGFSRMLVLVGTTNKKQLTLTSAKVQATSRWSPFQQISGQICVCA